MGTSPSPPKHPVIPDWLRDHYQVRTVVFSWCSRWFRIFAFQLIRTPLYAFRLAQISPHGLLRVIRKWSRWVADTTYIDDRGALRAAGGDVVELNRIHRSNIYRRSFISVAGFLGICLFTVLLFAWTHPLLLVLILLSGICTLGVLGLPMTSKSIVEKTSLPTHQAPPFNEQLMLLALENAGATPAGARPVRILQPPTRVRSGWEAVVSTSVEASEIIARRSQFASAIDRPENCVWLTSDPEQSASYLRIVVTRRSLRRSQVPDWPFLKETSFNWFNDDMPVGIDETGAPVTANKSEGSTVYGGHIGAGKSIALFNSVLTQTIDSRVEVHIYDLDGGTDWLPLEPIAHFLRSGSDLSDHEAILDDLEKINKRIDARFNTLKGLPENLKSQRVNDQLASMTELDLHPIVIVIDESQELLEFAEEASRYLTLVSRILKKGPTVGVTIEVATQNVSTKTLPIAGLCQWRHCMYVETQAEVEIVFGSEAVKAGLRADSFTPEDIGIGYFGTGADVSVIKSYHIDSFDPHLDDLISRLQRERTSRGLLTGMASGDIPRDTNFESAIDRVAKVWPRHADELQWVELIEFLHARFPRDYPEVIVIEDDSSPAVARAIEILSSQFERVGVEAQNVHSYFGPATDRTAIVRPGITELDVERAVQAQHQSAQEGTSEGVFVEEEGIQIAEPDSTKQKKPSQSNIADQKNPGVGNK